jgi:hypothetical protein
MKTRLVLRLVLYSTLGVIVVSTGSSFGRWVQAGLGMFFLGKATLAAFQLTGALKQESLEISTGRGVRAMALAYITAGCLIGIGALWQHSFFGFLVAYGAFSFSWVWYWVGRRIWTQDRQGAEARHLR